jgi:hypothetical protein
MHERRPFTPPSFVLQHTEDPFAIGSATTYGLTAAIIGSVVSSVVVSGLTYGIQAALYQPPDQLKPSTRIDNLRGIVKDNVSPWRVGFGRCRISGVLAYARSVNRDGIQVEGGPYLHFCLLMMHGPVEDIYDIQLNDDAASSVKYADLAVFVPFMGFRDQPMIRGPLQLDGVECALPGEWLKQYRPLRRIAGLWGLLRFDVKVFPGGAPNVRATIKGNLVFDPRKSTDAGGHQEAEIEDTWGYDTNPALAMRRYLTDRRFGLGVPQDGICEDCCIASANVCDEMIDAPSEKEDPDDPSEPMPQIRRYECDGVFETDQVPIDTMAKLNTAMAGATLFYGGLWHIKAGTTEPVAVDIGSSPATAVTLTPDDLRAGAALQVSPQPGRKDRVNTVRGTFINERNNFLPDDFAPVSHPQFLAEDGNTEFSVDIELPWTCKVDRARRLAQITLQQARLSQRLVWPGMPRLMQIVPWSVVYVCHPYLGFGFIGTATVDAATKTYAGTDIGAGVVVGQQWPVRGCSVAGNNGIKTVVAVSDDAVQVAESCTDEGPTYHVVAGGKLFRVMDRTLQSDWGVDLELWEYSDQIYADEIDPSKYPPRTGLGDPFLLQPPSGVTVQEQTHVNPDGTRVAKVVVQWTPPDDGFADGFDVRWRNLAGDLQWQTTVVRWPGTRYEIIGLEVGAYQVAVATVLQQRTSAFVTKTVRVTYETVPPPDPVDVRVRQLSDGQRLLTWALAGASAPPDLAGFELRVARGAKAGTLENWSGARVIGNAFARDRSFETAQPVAPGDYTFFVRSIDRQGFYSNGVGSVQVSLSAATMPSLLWQTDYAEDGWPTDHNGAIRDGVVNDRGELEGIADLTWDETDTWDTFLAWNAAGPAVAYTTPEQDMGPGNRYLRWTWQVRMRDGQRYVVQSRVKRADQPEWEPWGITLGGFGRWVQWRLVVYNEDLSNPRAPTAEGFLVRVFENDDSEFVEDFRMRLPTGLLDRIERDAAAFGSSAWQYGVEPRESSGLTTLTLVPHAAYLLDGAAGSYATAAVASARHNLPFSGWGLGAVCRPDSAMTGTGVLVGKGAAYRLCFDASAKQFFLYVNGAEWPGTRITVPDLFTVYAIDYQLDGGLLRGVLNGVERVVLNSDQSPFPVPPATVYPLRVGADHAGSQRFKGWLQEVAVWAGHRGRDELLRDYDTTSHRRDPRLAAYYPCNHVNNAAALFDASEGRINAAISGPRSFVVAGYREAPAVPLALIPSFLRAYASYTATVNDGTVVTQASVDDGATWQTLVNSGQVQALAGLATGDDVRTRSVRLRTYMEVSSGSQAPELTQTIVRVAYRRVTGLALVQPARRFSTLRTAEIVAVQDSTRPAAWSLVAKDRLGALFRVYDVENGAALDAVLDVRFRGARLTV